MFIAIFFTVSSCGSDEIVTEESFLKIYDDSDLDIDYRPIDVVETIDGFIILAGTELSKSDFMGVSLIKLNQEGEFQFQTDLPDYVVPIGKMKLNPADSNSYFFAMNPSSFQAFLLGVNPQLEVEVTAAIANTNYPLSSYALSNGNMLLQSYDPLTQETEIAEIGLDGTYQGGTQYSIGPGDDVLDEITNHYLNVSEKPLPFFCGEISTGSYYFNGFYNYILSLVFTDFSDAPSGVLQGLRPSNAGVRAVMPLTNGTFAIAGFQFDKNFQLPSVQLNTSGLDSSPNLYTGDLAELKPYTPVEIVNYSTTSDYTVFASETKSNQILLTFYDDAGAIAGLHRIGFLNPFSLSSMKVGTDNSLIVLGTTFVAGRFERIMVNKISEGELTALLP